MHKVLKGGIQAEVTNEMLLIAIKDLSGNFAMLEKRFDNLEIRFDNLEKRFDNLEQCFDRLADRVSNLENQFTEFKKEIKARN